MGQAGVGPAGMGRAAMRRAGMGRAAMGRAAMGRAAMRRAGMGPGWMGPATAPVAWSAGKCARELKEDRGSMHASSDVTLAVAVFLASAVESVEALTIIVAAGVSRGWRTALEGTAAALAVLIVLVGALGPALVYLVPINVLRTLVGALLLVFGLQWLRKAVLRTVGLKAKHDEDAIFREHVEALTVAGASGGSAGLQAPVPPGSASSGTAPADAGSSGSGSSGSG